MRDYVRQQRPAREHDAWLRGEIQQGMNEADNPSVKRLSHGEVAKSWQRQRAKLVKRAAKKPRAG